MVSLVTDYEIHMVYGIILLCIVVVLTVSYYRSLRKMRDGLWHRYDYDRMIRWDGTHWHYRKMTESELAEWYSGENW